MKSVILFFKNMTLSKGIMLILSPLISALFGMHTMIIALGFIIIMDNLTGIRKDLHNKKIKMNPLKMSFWRGIESSGFRNTWRKATEYGIGIIVVTVLDVMVLGGTLTLTLGSSVFTLSKFAVVVACLVETYSIFENMEEVSGNNIFKKMIMFFPEKYNKLLKKGV